MKIFPDSVIDQSYEKIISEHNKKTNLIYQILIITIIGVFISLFLIHVDVGVTITGIVQHQGDAHIIISPTDGILKILETEENKTVSQGDTLFIVTDIDSKQDNPIYSPINGICANSDQLTEGLKVSTGQKLIEILPIGGLRIECNIPSKNMGLIREGLSSRIRIDSYNYNQWGMLDGILTEISDNPVITYQGVFYKSYCSVDKDYLELKNGYRGYLKRGMNAHCRIVVTRRRIFDLLYDKVENWINPLNGGD